MRLAFFTLFPFLAAAAQRCTPVELNDRAASYISVQSGGVRPLPEGPQAFGNGVALVGWGGYLENFDSVSDRLIRKPMEISHDRTLLDTVSCETFTELIGTIDEKPYALGTRLGTARNNSAEIEMIWATTGHQGFDLERYLRAAKSEDWSTIPPSQRDTRKTLEALANSYLDALLLGKATVAPWGATCNSCQVGLPVPAVNIANRRYVIDETLGAVAVICTFGAAPDSGRIRTPDVHLFRIESGKVRYVHAITHLLSAK